MAEFKISFHEDSKFNLDHDNRKHSSPNINPEKTPENISYAGNISLQKFYEETFQKAYEEYIQKQIKGGHGNRVKNAPKTYYESVVQKQAEAEAELQKAIQGGKHGDELTRLDSYTRVAKQIIVQIGNTDDLEAMSPKERNETRDKMKEALQEYMETFQAENPNLRIVNAVIHMDEISLSPHLHLTYVPVVEQKRGQTVANSQSGALKAMGFESDKKADENGDFQTGQMKWQTRERERVIEIADKFGLSVGYQRGNRGKGLTIEDYRVAKQKEREALMSQEAIEKRKSELAEVQSELNRTTVEFNALSEDLYDTVAALSDSKSELRETEQEIIEKTEELNHLSEQVDQIPDVLNQSVDLCEQEMKAKLIPPVSPSDNYERTTKGVLSSKKTYVMVPEKDYEVLERRNGLKPQAVHGIIKDALQPLRDAIVQLPVVKNLIATIQRLEHEVGEWRKRCRKAEREKEALQKENAELKAEKAVADRVMQTKLNLSPQVIDIMKSQAAQELAREQRDKDDDVLGF